MKEREEVKRVMNNGRKWENTDREFVKRRRVIKREGNIWVNYCE